MISDILSIVNFLSEEIDDASVLSALFKYDGARLKGDPKIVVDVMNVSNNTNIWFYKVRPIDNYVFVSVPVNPSLYVDYGKMNGEKGLSANTFRYVSNPLSSFTEGGATNVSVDFMVFGYRPEDLLSYTKRRSIR